jgi:(2R)-3-sulfolactate dehydrogenase (NADP+)
MNVSIAELELLVARALERAGANAAMANSTARALVLAEAQGLGSHGLSRVAQYATHLRNGRAVGSAVPRVAKEHAAVAIVDAQCGLAFPACALAVQQAIERAAQFGVALVGVINSHHAGVMVDHLRPAAAAGMVGLAFTNSPAAMPAAGGRRAMLGTNPVAAIFPRRDAEPVMVDLSLSEVARGKIMVAAKKGEPIPTGWALDAQGQATTDAQAALAGSMLPIGAATSHKGATLALMVELLVTALIGAQFGFEASSFFVDEGNQPRLGQLFIVIDTRATAGRESYLARIETLLTSLTENDDGLRLPGQRRSALLNAAQTSGLNINESVLSSLSPDPQAQ